MIQSLEGKCMINVPTVFVGSLIVNPCQLYKPCASLRIVHFTTCGFLYTKDKICKISTILINQKKVINVYVQEAKNVGMGGALAVGYVNLS
jgi:hypothetical protein